MTIMKFTSHKFFISLILIILTSFYSFAQTGPGGVGNTDGTSGQPKNVLWLDASTLSYADGADLTLWNDISGNGNDLIQSNSSFTPIFRDNAGNINGHPRAEFSKSNNRMVINPFDDMPNSGITNFVIYKTAAGDGNDGLISYNTSSQDNAFLLFDSNNQRMYINGNVNTAGEDFSSGSWLMMADRWKSSGGDFILNRDGNQVYSANFQNGASIASGGSLALGGEQDNPGYSCDPAQDYDGEIAEVIMYNTFLNNAQRLIVENYLSQKYNIVFATASNDMFGNDAGFNSNYVYNIAGIGQEADGDHTQTSSGGLYLYEWNSSLANGEYLMSAHDNTTNNSATTYTGGDLPGGTEASWARQWYVEKTSSDGVDAKLIFDFKEALTDGEYPANVANYVLLYRSAATGAYSVITVAGQGLNDADQVYFDVPDANLQNGYYTIGTNDETNSPVEGVAGRTWYALASGDWDTWDYWTLDPSGSLPNNPSHETPSSGDKVVIHTGKTITVSTNSKNLAEITVDGILQLGTTSGHNYTKINGSGRIKLASDNFPLGDATDFITKGQGEGTVVWQGGSYNLSTPHTFYNMEVGLDAAGNTLTMLADYTLNGSLVIETGQFQINDNSSTTNLILTVNGDVTVDANGQILTGSANARHQFNMNGDFTNNGTVKFTNRAAADYANEATDGIVDANFLNGSANQTVSCNGITNFYRIEIDKGTDMTYELSISASSTANFKLYGYASQAHGSVAQLTTNDNALGLLKGTVRIRNNVQIPHLNRSGNYNISEAARLWVDGGTVSTSVSNAIVPYGEAKITAGTFEALVPQGFTLRENGAVIVEGGTLNANQIRTSVLGTGHVGSYIQSGGTTNIISPGNTNANYYHFSMTYPGNVFNMSGGTLHVYDANGSDSNSGGIFIASDPANYNVTGGTVIAEIAGTSNPFKITSTAPFYNLILRNTFDSATDHILDAGTNINGTADADLAAQPLVVLNDLTIEDNCFLDHNGEDISVGAGFSIAENSQKQGTNNYGLLYDASKPNTLTFNGSTSDTLYVGHNVDDGYELYLWNLNINKTNNSEIVLKGDPNKDPTQTSLSSEWHNRLIHINGTTDVQKGTINQGHQSIRLYGPVYVRTNGILGVYESGTTPLTAYIMLKDDGTSSTDLNTEQGAQLGNFKLNPGNGNEVGILSDVHIKRIGSFSGALNLRTYKLTLDYLHNQSTTNNWTGGNTNRMIYSDANASDGGLELYIPGGITSNTDFGFPLGTKTTITRYTPVRVRVSSSSDDGYIQIRPVDGELQTTNLSGGNLLSYYWRVGHSGFTGLPTILYRFTYDDSDDDAGDETNFIAGKVLDENPFTRAPQSGTIGSVNTTNNRINFDALTLEKANYTAGVANRFTGSVTVYYSRLFNGWTNNQWSDPNVWSTVSHNSSTNTGTYPQTGDIARVGYDTGNTNGGSGGDYHSILCDINNINVASLIFDGDGTTWNPRVYVQETQTHNFNMISGRGGFVERVSPTNIPTVNADFGDFVNNTDAYFYYHCRADGTTTLPTHEVYPNLRIEGNTSSGVGNRILIFPVDIEVKRDMRIDGGAVIRTDNDADGDILVDRSLYVGGYRDGAFEFSTDGTARTLTVKGDITIRDGQAQSPNNYLSVLNTTPNGLEHKIILYGDLIQREGTLDLFSDNSGGNNAVLELQDGQNATYTYLAGNTADLYRIVMNKGTDQTYSFSFEDNVNLGGSTSGAGIKKSIELLNGTLILNDPAINLDINTGDDNFEIPGTSCLEVRQGQVNVSGDDTGILLDGKLLVSGGTVNMDDAVNNGNNYIQYSASGNAELIITSGNLTVGSQIRRGLTSTEGILRYNQSSGTVIIGKNNAPEGKRGVFEILNAGSSFKYSGGDLYIVRQQTNPTFASLYLDPETNNISSGTTITLGNGDTPSNQEFGIYSTVALQNLSLDNTSTNNPKAKMWTVPLTLNGELNIQSGTEFKADGLDLNCYGNFTNAGTFTADGNTTYFKSNLNQQIDGNTTFYNITNQNTANLNLASGNAAIVVDNILNLENGTFNDNANEISVYGDINNDAIHVYGGTGVEDGISLLGTSQQTMTGNGTYGKLTINNGNGVVLPVGNTPVITDYLKLEAGVLNIGGNILTLGVNCVIQEANPFGVNNMIGTNVSFTDYGVKKYFPSGAGSFTYPVGSVSGATNKYTPVVITVTQNSSTTGYLIAKPADEIHPTIVDDSEGSDPDIVDMDNVLQFYWVLSAQNFTDGTGTVEFYYDENDVRVTAPYDIYDYITAKLLEDGSGNWYKFDDVSKFDETNKKLIFDFNNVSDVDISGDYTAGVDGSTFLGAIPDQVPLYASKGVLGTGPYPGLDWHTADTWRVDDGTGTWVLPASIGLPDIPNGSRVRIISGDRVTTAANYISAYTTDILGTFDVGTTFGNRIGNVSGTGTLYTERGSLPGGYYEEFLAVTGGTLEFGGTTDYSVLSNIPQVNNLIFSGTNKRELPNLNLIVLGDFTINGTDATLKVINEFDQKIDLRKNAIYNTGSFDAGTGTGAIVEFNGTSGMQTLSGTGGFTGSNAFNNVIINNTNGVSLSIPVDVSNSFTFTDGIIHTDATNILKLTNTLETIVSGAGNGKYVDGPVSKNVISGQNFEFPTGNSNRYGKVAVLSSSVSDYWIAQYYNHNPNDDGYDPTVFNTPLQVVSDNEYWRILGPSGQTAKVKLYWNDQSGGFADDAHRSDMRIAEWRDINNDSPGTTTDDIWEELDSDNTIAGDATSGSITPNNNSSTYNEFTNGNIFTISTTYVPNNFDWEGDVSTAWEDGNNWSGGSVPSGLDDITITTVNPNEPTISSAAECNALALANGRTLTVSAGNSLTLNGDFSFNGTLVLKSPAGEGPSASFIDNGTITGTTGEIRVERFLSANKFHYVSSPIQTGGNAGSDLFTQVHSSGNFNPNFYVYDETFDLDGNPGTAPSGTFDSNNLVPGWTYAYPDQTTNDPMEIETGYAFWSDENTTVTFIGDPNTGDININNLSYTDNDPVAGTLPNYYDGWNLISNPYPSAIDWDLAKAERTNLDDAIYVWDGTQYASYAGGVQGGSTNLTNEIAPMQAFFVHATSDPGSITLKNTHRVHSSGNYLKSPVDGNNENIPYFIKLKMEANGYSDYTVVYFKSNATNGFDSNFDAYKLFSNVSSVPHLYSVTEINNIPMSINSLHSSSMQDVTVPLCIKIGKAGTYSISLDEFNFEGYYVYFIDKYNDTHIELNNETLDNYTFSCDAGELTNRFELHIFKNHAPYADGLIPDMEIPVSEPYAYTFGENVFVDVDFGDEIRYSAQLSDGSELPLWLMFNPETRTFEGTPESIDALEINVTATDKLGASATESFMLTVTGNSVVGDILKSNKILIYPNPASDFIYIKQAISDDETTISITDITGKVLLKTKINSTVFRINVSNFAAGSYFVKVQSDTQTLRDKIIIRK